MGGGVLAKRPASSGTSPAFTQPAMPAFQTSELRVSWPEALERKIKQLQAYGRPIICTEYLARSAGSTFDSSLPIARKYDVGMINWGLVSGKTQTIYPWDSVGRPYTSPPTVWFHDVFHPDGRPYRQAEADQIKALTSEAQQSASVADRTCIESLPRRMGRAVRSRRRSWKAPR